MLGLVVLKIETRGPNEELSLTRSGHQHIRSGGLAIVSTSVV
jgi:hypothetical protein